MEEHLRHAFGRTAGLAGFTISTGVALAQGRFVDETVQTASGSVGLRRNLSPIRVRETLVVPLSEDAANTAGFIGHAYDAEPASLERSLQLAGLGSVDEIFPRRPAG